MFAKVVFAHWKELLTAAYIGSFVLVLTAYFVFLIEHEVNNQFASMADSVWWTFITFYRYCVLYCTVLYCIALYCTVLYWTVLYCTVLHCTVQGRQLNNLL